MVKKPEVSGVKIIQCPSCNGHGKIYLYEDNIYGSDITKIVMCKQCNGTGETIDE
jgi:DnaJ-class molecular chaperone